MISIYKNKICLYCFQLMNWAVCFIYLTFLFFLSFNSLFLIFNLEKNLTLQYNLTILGGKSGFFFNMNCWTFSKGFEHFLIESQFNMLKSLSQFSTILITCSSGCSIFPHLWEKFKIQEHIYQPLTSTSCKYSLLHNWRSGLLGPLLNAWSSYTLMPCPLPSHSVPQKVSTASLRNPILTKFSG